MPRSMSVYLSDDLVRKLEPFPEVNASEVMRKGLIDYLEQREKEQFAIEEVRQLREEVTQLVSSNVINFGNLIRRIEQLEHKEESS